MDITQLFDKKFTYSDYTFTLTMDENNYYVIFCGVTQLVMKFELSYNSLAITVENEAKELPYTYKIIEDDNKYTIRIHRGYGIFNYDLIPVDDNV